MKTIEIRIILQIGYRRFPAGLVEHTHLEIIPEGPGWDLANLRGKIWAEVLDFCRQFGYIPDSWRVLHIRRGPIDLLSTPPGGPGALPEIPPGAPGNSAEASGPGD